jgi:hypothetical protein
MTRAISDLGNRVAARSDEIVDVPEATGSLVVDDDASFRIFVPAARTSRTWEEDGHRILRVCGGGLQGRAVLPPLVVGRALDRAIVGRTHGLILLAGAGCEWTRTVLPRGLLRAESAGPVAELVQCLPDKDGWWMVWPTGGLVEMETR